MRDGREIFPVFVKRTGDKITYNCYIDVILSGKDPLGSEEFRTAVFWREDVTVAKIPKIDAEQNSPAPAGQ